MFSQASVILFTRGGGLYPNMHWGRHPPMARQPPPPSWDGHCSGRYASYWNAFLFLMLFRWERTGYQNTRAEPQGANHVRHEGTLASRALLWHPRDPDSLLWQPEGSRRGSPDRYVGALLRLDRWILYVFSWSWLLKQVALNLWKILEKKWGRFKTEGSSNAGNKSVCAKFCVLRET